VSRLPALLLALPALALAACGDEENGDEPAEAPAQTSQRAGGCEDVRAPAARRDGGERKPTAKLDPDKTYDVTFATSCGDMTIRLDVKTSPRTAASFASLARKGFFDDTTFHRIVPGFVIQGGDPTGSGSGGPGYSTRDEPPSDTTYARGSVAMAKTADEPPGTAGSQFYVVTGDASQLPPEYAVLGRVVKGLAVAERIGRLGDPASGEAGTPLRPVVIERARVDVS
jgi:peptidyl-prolyl cis-trans isomerase B (cyclophilin B)